VAVGIKVKEIFEQRQPCGERGRENHSSVSRTR
jgi:hypothetical protein